MFGATEIIVIAVGLVVMLLGFVLPGGKGGEGPVDIEDLGDLVQERLDRSLNESVRRTIDGMAREAVSEAIDDSKLELSRISTEKVMEISEYAGTVMEDIKKNHDEVVFMYDMLNDKHKNMLTTVTEMTKTTETAKQAVRDAELTARDAMDAVATLDAATARAKVAAEAQRAAAHALPEEAPAEVVSLPEAPVAPTMMAQETEGNGSGVLHPEAAVADLSMEQEVPLLSEQDVAALALEQQGVKPRAPESPAPPAEPMSQNRRILEMHAEGKSNMVIARELGLGIGEVRLVIDLSRKQIKNG